MDIQIITAPLNRSHHRAYPNGIAIKMIFRPLYPKYLGGWRVPFTPGLIPKERGRLAKSIGTTISLNLMNQEVLERNLLSEDMYEKIQVAIDKFVEQQKGNVQSLREFLYALLSKDDIDAIVLNTKGDLSCLLQKELSNPRIGEQVAHAVVEYALKKVRESLFGMLGIDQFVYLIAIPAEGLLAKNVNQMFASNSVQLIDDLLHILNTIDISKIIEDRINDMDMEEVERLTLQVMDKELKAIVWLGGLLGLLMGFMNVLIG